MTEATPAGRMRLPYGMRALYHRNFRLFWTGMLISLIGTWMESVAQSWLILQLTNDPVALGIRAAAQFTPVLILGLFGGVIADAFPKRPALLVTQSLAGIFAFVMFLLVFLGGVQPWQVYLIAVLYGTVNAFDMPIRQSFVTEMVGQDDITSAVALNSSVFNGTRIVGPAVAGILIATVGLSACFFLNAISYIAVVASILMMDKRELLAPPMTRLQRTARSVTDQLVEGLRYIRQTRPLLLAITILGIVATVAINFQVTLPLLARDVLGGDATTYGFLNSAAGVGSLTGALVLAVTGRAPTFQRLLVGAASIGVALIGLGWSQSLPMSMVLLAVAGWGTITMGATTNMLIQLISPPQLRGRAISVYTTVFAGTTPFGSLLIGEIIAYAGTAASFILAGVASVATAAAGWALSTQERALGIDITEAGALDAAALAARSTRAAAAQAPPTPAPAPAERRAP
jgi:MFS family permease